MFLAADILVKAVMVSLAFASLVTWTIFLAKTCSSSMAQAARSTERLRGSPRRARCRKRRLALGTRGNVRRGVAARLPCTKCGCRPTSPSTAASRSARPRALREIARAEARVVAASAWALLATIGSTAPFVGLFGTVWGIMNSFIGISKAQTTNLAVVAPGIAEALLATAIGLVAAIPAVIIYNHFARATQGLSRTRRPRLRRGRPPAVARSRPRAAAGMLSRAAE